MGNKAIALLAIPDMMTLVKPVGPAAEVKAKDKPQDTTTREEWLQVAAAARAAEARRVENSQNELVLMDTEAVMAGLERVVKQFVDGASIAYTPSVPTTQAMATLPDASRVEDTEKP